MWLLPTRFLKRLSKAGLGPVGSHVIKVRKVRLQENATICIIANTIQGRIHLWPCKRPEPSRKLNTTFCRISYCIILTVRLLWSAAHRKLTRESKLAVQTTVYDVHLSFSLIAILCLAVSFFEKIRHIYSCQFTPTTG